MKSLFSRKVAKVRHSITKRSKNDLDQQVDVIKEQFSAIERITTSICEEYGHFSKHYLLASNSLHKICGLLSELQNLGPLLEDCIGESESERSSEEGAQINDKIGDGNGIAVSRSITSIFGGLSDIMRSTISQTSSQITELANFLSCFKHENNTGFEELLLLQRQMVSAEKQMNKDVEDKNKNQRFQDVHKAFVRHESQWIHKLTASSSITRTSVLSILTEFIATFKEYHLVYLDRNDHDISKASDQCKNYSQKTHLMLQSRQTALSQSLANNPTARWSTVRALTDSVILTNAEEKNQPNFLQDPTSSTSPGMFFASAGITVGRYTPSVSASPEFVRKSSHRHSSPAISWSNSTECEPPPISIRSVEPPPKPRRPTIASVDYRYLEEHIPGVTLGSQTKPKLSFQKDETNHESLSLEINPEKKTVSWDPFDDVEHQKPAYQPFSTADEALSYMSRKSADLVDFTDADFMKSLTERRKSRNSIGSGVDIESPVTGVAPPPPRRPSIASVNIEKQMDHYIHSDQIQPSEPDAPNQTPNPGLIFNPFSAPTIAAIDISQHSDHYIEPSPHSFENSKQTEETHIQETLTHEMQEKVSETENDSKAMPLFTPDEAYAYLSQRP